jgi:hypothetical protein
MSRLILLVGLVTLLHAQGDRARTGDAIGKLQLAVTRAGLGDGLTAQDQAMLRDIGRSADKLDDRFKNAAAAEPAEEFAKSLSDDAQALDRLPASTGERTAILKDIRDDLELKARFTSRGLTASTAFPSVVNVTIETERNGRTVNGLWVRSNPRRYGVTDTPMFVFPSASSPTARRMPPGVFTMWVESADHRVLATQIIEIGATEQDSERIRFTIP